MTVFNKGVNSLFCLKGVDPFIDPFIINQELLDKGLATAYKG